MLLCAAKGEIPADSPRTGSSSPPDRHSPWHVIPPWIGDLCLSVREPECVCDADAPTNTCKNVCISCRDSSSILLHPHTHTHMLKHTHSKHIPSQICIFLIPSTLLQLLLLSSPCLSGVIVSILLHQGAPEGYKLNINANALSHCPPPPPSSYTHTHTHPSHSNRSVCLQINRRTVGFF